MGPNPGNGAVAIELGATMHNNGPGLPQATEYTLQGVMRFLQTEWHRHERDRNAWEIEKQEMKGRIANLEGQARRADATQRALKKYVSILERKVKNQAVLLKGPAAAESAEALKNDRSAKIQEKLRCEFSIYAPFLDIGLKSMPQLPRRSSPYPGWRAWAWSSRTPTTRRIGKNSRPSSTSVSLNLCTSWFLPRTHNHPESPLRCR